MPKQTTSLVDICRDHAQQRGARFAFCFSNGDKIVASLSFAELDDAARTVAGFLQSRCQPGDRVLLLLESGIDFVRGFFGCLYAGVIAVPMNLPAGPRHLLTTLAIAQNAGARLMLASAAALKFVNTQNPEFECVELASLFQDEQREPYRDPNLVSSAPAFLQYTSGSTGSPKGVVVTHANLLANLAMIKSGFSHGEDCVGAGWLPLTHDMGLVGTVLQAAYLGIPSFLMPPLAFVRRPVRWLKMISEHRVTTTGGPDFAYSLCVRRLEDEQLEGLDLSSWRVAFNGAEPVRAQTLRAFSRKFARVGFSANAFFPCYGLAEATLFVAGPEAYTPVRVRRVPADALEEGLVPEQDAEDDESERVRALVACGEPCAGAVVRIVQPDTCAVLGAREVGEIWIAGPHVANGYWNNAEATARAFDAYTRDGEGPFLRSGDLGFLESGKLYITGRIKDLLIVGGKNHYPQDIEHTASQCHAVLVGRPAAAFLIPEHEREVLVLVQEVSRAFSMGYAKGVREPAIEDLKAKIADAVVREHGLAVKHLLLVPQGSLPMTTSGKIQRSKSQQLLIGNKFKEIEPQNARVQAP